MMNDQSFETRWAASVKSPSLLLSSYYTTVNHIRRLPGVVQIAGSENRGEHPKIGSSDGIGGFCAQTEDDLRGGGGQGAEGEYKVLAGRW